MQNIETRSTAFGLGRKVPTRLLRMLKSVEADLPDDISFELEFGGELFHIGNGAMAFRVLVHNTEGMKALSSLDEKRIGEAYLDSDITIEGDLVAAFDLRASLTDRHFLFYLWSTYGQRLFFGQK